MSTLKTTPNERSVDAFLAGIEDADVRDDCRTIARLMAKATKAEPRLWGSSIVGFGTYEMQYADGHAGTWMLTAFSPRKRNITLYIMSGFAEYDDLLSKLGKHSCGKTCLYIKRLSDVHLPTLKRLIEASVRHMKSRYPTA